MESSVWAIVGFQCRKCSISNHATSLRVGPRLRSVFCSLFGGTSQARQTPAGMLGYDDFIRDTRNSPAMQSGAFDPKDLYETYKRNQQFKADRKSGKLRKDRMAGDRIRITMPMDLE